MAVKPSRTSANAIASVVQILVSGLLLVILYGYLVRTIGMDGLGIWSLILAASSLGRLTELGLSGSSVKFVAKYLAQEDTDKVSLVIETSLLVVSCFVALCLILLYPLAVYGLQIIIQDPQSALLAASILPFGFASVFFSVITSAIHGALDGSQRIDLRCWIIISGNVLILVSALVLVPTYGIFGLAWGYVSSSLVITLASWITLRRQLTFLPAIPSRFRMSVFREIFAYSANFQVITISLFFAEPATKALLSYFGGLTFVGLYEMASKLITQARNVIVSATQVIVPVVATYKEISPSHIRELYTKTLSLVLGLSIPFYGLGLAMLPLISFYWLGALDLVFMQVCFVISVAWLLNTISGPAFFTFMGIGELRAVTLSHVYLGLSCVIIGYLLGNLIGSWGPIFGWAFATSSSALFIVWHFHTRHLKGEQLIRRDDSLLIAAVIIGLLAAGIFFIIFYQDATPLFIGVGTVFFYAIIPAYPLLRHPVVDLLIARYFAYRNRISAIK